MPPPSQLSIATSVVNRLVKEEASYHKELERQQTSIAKLEQGGGDENAEYVLKQERRGVEETKAIFPQLKQKMQDALARLEQQLVCLPRSLSPVILPSLLAVAGLVVLTVAQEQDKGPGDQSSPEDITKAKEAIAAALKAIRESS
ncbi:tubulin folding cofactor A [Teratosphaeriaceae sp. CCFEE 6253]|nr:tubulin folding cofactor A [Teratosphaeriaceae sp. CCFEE 6253]